MNVRPIDANALKNALCHAVLDIADTPAPNEYASKLAVKMGELFKKLVDDAPTIDAEPVRHGRWKAGNSEFGWAEDIDCSECGSMYNFFKKPNYCPNCGAKMGAEVQHDQ